MNGVPARAGPDLLVVGEVNPDLIVSDSDPAPVFGQVEKLVDEASLTVGSSAAIFACGAARLGLRTSFVGVVGDDVFGRFMLAEMGVRGVDTSGCIVDPTTPTGLSVILARGDDRAILTYPGSIGALKADQVPDRLVREARHLHVSSYYLLRSARADLPALFAAARAAGTSTSFDCNWDPEERWTDGLDDMLAVSDIFFLNAEEARRITGLPDELDAARGLARGRDVTVVVKRGPLGAVAYRGDEMLSVPAATVTPVDTVGAGDSFDAGYVHGWLNGLSPREALGLAVTCGSLSTQARGGTIGQPTLAAARAALRNGAVA